MELIRRLIRQLTCAHERRQVLQIHRDWNTYARIMQYHCPDCDRNWQTRQLPEGLRQH
jgi:hypothetical protein